MADTQDLSIRANRFIQYIRENFSTEPISVARPNKDGNPEVTVINGETREVVSVTFTEDSIKVGNEFETPVNQNTLETNTLKEVGKVVGDKLF